MATRPSGDLLALGGLIFASVCVLLDAYLTPRLPSTTSGECLRPYPNLIGEKGIESLNEKGFAVVPQCRIPAEVIYSARIAAGKLFGDGHKGWSRQNDVSVRQDKVMLIGENEEGVSDAVLAIVSAIRGVTSELDENVDYLMTSNRRVPLDCQVSMRIEMVFRLACAATDGHSYARFAPLLRKRCIWLFMTVPKVATKFTVTMPPLGTR